MNEKSKLYRAIIRSESAYALYLKHKRYIDALRIRNANDEVYTLLTDFQYTCSETMIKEVHDYLFHLEDWFAQFAFLEQTLVPDLETIFVFQRLDFSLPFPSTFKQQIDS